MRSTFRNAPHRRAQATLAIALSLVACGHAAHAAEKARSASRSAPPSPDSTADHTDDGVRAGVIAGIGFPRPIAVEGLVFVGRRLAIGLEYGALPTITVAGGGTKLGTMPALLRGQPPNQVSIDGVHVDLWSLAGDCRWFPFGTSFFVGVRAGRQHVGASTTLHMSQLGSTPETLGLDSWFVNPRMGFLWAPRAGLAIGVEAGLQVPLQSVLSSTLPLSLDPVVRGTAEQLGSSMLPTIDLLRLGMVL